MTTIYENDEYWNDHKTFHEGDAAFKAKCCLAALEASGISPKRVLDIGCGSGKFLHCLSDLLPSSEFLGIDVSPTPIDRANALHAKSNIKFEVRDVSSIDQQFDLVTANDVFEHVDDYIGFLKHIHTTGTTFYFNIPLDMTAFSVLRHAYMRARSNLGHLHYFSKQSALATLEYCGFSVLHHQYNHSEIHALRKNINFRRYVAAIPRIITFKVAPDASVHLLSGATLGVVCRPIIQ